MSPVTLVRILQSSYMIKAAGNRHMGKLWSQRTFIFHIVCILSEMLTYLEEVFLLTDIVNVELNSNERKCLERYGTKFPFIYDVI